MSAARDQLATYRAKRDFTRSPEPAGGKAKKAQALRYLVQRHDATRLHYDLRLEWAGVLKSWAVTRGPSMDPADKRLAVEVEDHPLEYGDFEGVIPAPGYGAGTVQLWDTGSWAPLDSKTVEQDLAKGELKFVLAGERLRGGFVLIRLKPRKGEKPEARNWLLIKEKDSVATPGEGDAVLRAETSVVSGKTLAQIAAGGGAEWHSKPKDPPTAAQKRKPAPKPAPTPDPVAAVPDFLPPQLCLAVETPPVGPGWVHELKLDGYRLQVRIAAGRATIRTRTGLDWTKRFPAIARAAATLPDAVLDGEAVMLDDAGQPDFARLQAVLAGEAKGDPILYAFDLPILGTEDLRPLPLSARKQRLRDLLNKPPAGLRFLEHFDAPGESVLASACKLSLEGIVSKRLDAPYRAGRGDAWVKSKCRGRDEFVVGGWSTGKSGHGLGALLVGARRDGKLVYLGRVGTGFSGKTADGLLRQLKPQTAAKTPFVGQQPARTSDVSWCQPELVVEVAYGGWTDDGLLRHASFQGVREDKPAAEVRPPPTPVPPPDAPKAAPKPAPKRKAAPGISHPDRVLWPATDSTPAVTKADLAAYFERYAERILAQVAGRPLSILRAPDGIGSPLFFQRHAMPGQSPLIGQVPVAGQPKPYMRIDDLPGLMALAQVSAVELHPWGAMADSVETPDRLVFDFDPAEGLGFDAVIAATLEIRERLRKLGLEPFVKATGGKGLHVVVPLCKPKRGSALAWPEAKAFARLLCTVMERDAPDRFTTTLAKKARTGRIFLDYLRNDRLSTAVAGWSTRGRTGAPVARPIPWSAVKPGLKPDAWRVPALLTDPPGRDPWADLAAAAVPLGDAARKLTG